MRSSLFCKTIPKFCIVLTSSKWNSFKSTVYHIWLKDPEYTTISSNVSTSHCFSEKWQVISFWIFWDSHRQLFKSLLSLFLNPWCNSPTPNSTDPPPRNVVHNRLTLLAINRFCRISQTQNECVYCMNVYI